MNNKPIYGIPVGGGGGGTKYTNPEPLLNSVGGILAKNHTNGFDNVPINDLITELLYPYQPPTVAITGRMPIMLANEKNVPIWIDWVMATVTKKSKSISSVSLYKGDVLIEEKTDEISSSGTTLQFDIDEQLDGTTDVTYTIKVTEEGDNAQTVSQSIDYTFIYPYYFGTVANSTEITSDVITSFSSKYVVTKSDKLFTYTTDNTCPVMAYPKSYGTLKSIIDPNNFTQNWSLSTVTVNNGSNILDVDYYVYVGGASTATATYKFNY